MCMYNFVKPFDNYQWDAVTIELHMVETDGRAKISFKMKWVQPVTFCISDDKWDCGFENYSRIIELNWFITFYGTSEGCG